MLQLAMGRVQMMLLFYRYFITLLYIVVSARATEYTSSGDNCSHQPPLIPPLVSKGSYYGSVDASCPRPLKPWRSLKAPCKPKVNLLMPKAEGTWYKASPTPVWLSQCTCLRTPYARCMYSDPIDMDFESESADSRRALQLGAQGVRVASLDS